MQRIISTSESSAQSQWSVPPPQKIEIQEIWLRDHKRDLHLIEKDTCSCNDGTFAYKYVSPVAKNKLPVTLDEWLRREIPETPIGVVWPHAYSDPIEGGWLMPYVDFSNEGLARYIAEWENIDQQARTAGFKLETVEYAKWREKLSRYEIQKIPRTSPAKVWWCDTPIGLLWCSMEHEKKFTARFSISNHRNLWIRTQEQYPQIGNLEFNEVVVGILIPNRNQKNAWFCKTEIYLSNKKIYLPSILANGSKDQLNLPRVHLASVKFALFSALKRNW